MNERPGFQKMIGWLLLLIVVLMLVVEMIKPVLHVFTSGKITISKDDLGAKEPNRRVLQEEERRIKHYYRGHEILLVGEGDKITVSKDDLGAAPNRRRVLQEERRTTHDNSSHNILLVGEGDKITVSSKDDLGAKAPNRRVLQEESKIKNNNSSHNILLVGEGDKIPVSSKCDLGAKASKRRIKNNNSSNKILSVREGDKITVSKDDSRAKAPDGRVLQKERRIKHYYSSHKILLVGEGDFSFSACLAKVFGSADNMVATSFNSKGFLKKNYGNAMSNINDLTSRRCVVLHGVDATNMSGHKFLRGMKFDRIVFNFPYAGFFKKESRESQLSQHQKLVTLFFKNAKKMLSEVGEIHISHKSVGFHSEWNIEYLASLSGLNFIKAVKFNLNDYPGHNTKRGFGGDENFDCNPSKTYMFGLY